MSLNNIVHVVVAVIKNPQGQIFIAKRAVESHQGGLWEFPGGKIENNEKILDALKRELFEEIGITLIQSTPLIQIHHNYSDKSVLLDVWCVNEFDGEAFGKEEQETRWINESEFPLYEFPAANLPIIKAIQLPDRYMITGKFKNEEELLSRVKKGLENNIKLIQFRTKNLAEELYFDYAKKIYTLCERKQAKLLLNTSLEKYKKYQANEFSHGLHLNAKEMESFFIGALNSELIVSTSTHNLDELHLAEEKAIDCVMLSPVLKTMTHPDATPLGWKKFGQLIEKINIPVYALGGMTEKEMETAKTKGAHGIAAIGLFWDA
jgi:8-oxo-dGTP diphosphatase